MDEYSALSGVAPGAILALEDKLLKTADLVIVSADRLLQAKRRVNPHTVLVRHGVDFEHFQQAHDRLCTVSRTVESGTPVKTQIL